jgi:WD40 repeat protein
MPMGFHSPRSKASIQKVYDSVPYHRIPLEKSSIQSNFYNHPIDWSSKDVLAVLLEDLTFVKDRSSSFAKSLCEVGDSISLKFNDSGERLALGSTFGVIRIADIIKDAIIAQFPGIVANAYCLDFQSHLIISGHDEGKLFLWDERANHSPQAAMIGHNSMCCALRWNGWDGNRFASGSDDSSCKIWDIRKTDKPLVVFEQHKAAVRAISWSEKNCNRIATGGGTQDRHIKVWDSETGQVVLDASAGSQICNLFWNHEFKEIISTQGFHDCTIGFWREKDLKAVGSISGHQDRVIYAAPSSDQRNLATLTPKDGLQFWCLFKDHNATTSMSQLR